MSLPSIFNDVIGPVMRGPSSSHCVAALRIGRIARDLMAGKIETVTVEFDTHGSLASTHESQGSDMGLFAGLLGWDAADERMVQSRDALKAAGIEPRILIADFGASHPSTYRLTIKNSIERHTMTAISTGGGMMEIVELDGAPVSIGGDYHETLLYFDAYPQAVIEVLTSTIGFDECSVHTGRDTVHIVEIKAQHCVDEAVIAALPRNHPIRYVKHISPVVPVLSRKGITVPFGTSEEMLRFNADKNLPLWELAVLYESARGDISARDVFSRMKEIAGIMQRSIQTGMEGTAYSDRILGYQSGVFRSRMESGGLLDGGMLNRIILYVTAMMEVKSSMGLIVAAPTAGACAVVPGVCFGAAHERGVPIDGTTHALLAAGMIGIFIAGHATFSAELGGCQAECGAGSAMAAAALVTLANGTAQQAVNAASMALQNILGMICDPVAGRVEVPCLGKNVLAASNAFACANMALADFDPVIPLDEVIDTMDRVGKSIPGELRCTAQGGLSITRTSKEIGKRLNTCGDHPSGRKSNG